MEVLNVEVSEEESVEDTVVELAALVEVIVEVNVLLVIVIKIVLVCQTVVVDSSEEVAEVSIVDEPLEDWESADDVATNEDSSLETLVVVESLEEEPVIDEGADTVESETVP